MKAITPKNTFTHHRLEVQTLVKQINGWCVVILLLQLIIVSPLDRGLNNIHLIFLKPFSAVIPVHDIPIQEQTVVGNARKVSPVRNKKDYLFHPIIIEVANRHEIDPALVKAIIMAESGYNPKAISKRGAKGLMQLMPTTAKSLGVEDIFDPEHNINGGVRYFKRLVNLFKGDVKLALAAYNAGIRKVKKYQGIPPFKSTKYYIKKVFKYYEYYQEQMAVDLNRT